MSRALATTAISALAACAYAQAQAAQPATAPATRPATQAANVSPFLEHDAPLSPEPAIPLSEAVGFRLADGFLLVQTSLTPSPSQLRNVEGLATPAKIMVMHRGEVSAKPYTPDQFQFTATQVSEGVAMQMSIFSIAGHTDITRYIIAGETEMSIQFIQRQQANTDGQAASLVVQSLAPSAQDDKQRYAAESFAAFIRLHPEPTTRYVRPMIESVGPQPHLFAVDDSLASYVFPEAFVPGPEQQAEIQKLIDQLNADEFQVRQRATQALEQMGVTAVARLNAMNRASLEPEQATRIDAIIARVRPPFTVDRQVLRSDRGFLLDCLLSNNPAVRDIALTRLSEVTNEPITFAPGDDEASRVKAVYDLRERLTTVTLVPTTQPK